MLGADAGDFFHPRSLWSSSLALPSIGEPTVLSQCSPKPCKERTWIMFLSQGVGLGSLPPALGFVTWLCPAGNSISVRREGTGCGKSLPWGGLSVSLGTWPQQHPWGTGCSWPGTHLSLSLHFLDLAPQGCILLPGPPDGPQKPHGYGYVCKNHMDLFTLPKTTWIQARSLRLIYCHQPTPPWWLQPSAPIEPPPRGGFREGCHSAESWGHPRVTLKPGSHESQDHAGARITLPA